jgi:predicted nucleic acid-binding protein
MTVFIDTNVILDYVLRREHYAEAKETIVKLVAAGVYNLQHLRLSRRGYQ